MLKIFKKRLLLILGLFVLSIGISVGIIYSVLPEVYDAQTQILVNQKSSEKEIYSWSTIDMELRLIDTYNVVIKSPAILEKVISNLKIDTTPEELAKKIIVSNEEDSKVVNIKVEDQDPLQAVKLANMVAKVFKTEVPNLMSVDNINILSKAKQKENPKPVKPNKLLIIGIAAAIGLMSGLGIAFIMEILDTTIKTEKDLEEITALPIIGFISPIEKDIR